MPIGPLRSGRAPSWEPVRFIIEQRQSGFVRAVALSGVVHLALVWSLFIIPSSPVRKAPSFESVSVDLVGGEKLGGAMPAPRAAPAAPVAPPPEAKQESVKAKEESPPRLTAKERRKIAAERKAAELAERKAADMAEKALALKTKKEAKKAEKIPPKKEEVAAAQKEQELSAAVREKLIQAKLEQLRERVESEQVKQKPAPPPPVVAARPGEGQGAAGPGVGGKGGGLAKGIEFVQYYSLMMQRIKSSWAWVSR